MSDAPAISESRATPVTRRPLGNSERIRDRVCRTFSSVDERASASARGPIGEASSPIRLPVAWKNAFFPTSTSSLTDVLVIVQTPLSGTTRSPVMV